MRELADYRHHPGVHCASAALRNIVAHHTGLRWSEAMCFGLAAGLNFTYVQEHGSPCFLVMGRGSYMESHFCDALEVVLEATHTDDPATAWRHLRKRLDAGQLVLVDTDMFELPYMVQRLNLPGGLHFGGHKVLVTGHDEAAGTVELADYAWQRRQVVPVQALMAARDSRQCPSRPRNACYVFHFPEQLPPLERAVQAALATVVNQMRHPFRHYNGLPAIARFCRQWPKWHLSMRGEDLRRNLALAAFMLEKAGTGGGGFRNLYSRFLAEAAVLLRAPALEEAAGTYRRLSMRWREAASMMDTAAEHAAAGVPAPQSDAVRLMSAIADDEQLGMDQIARYVGTTMHQEVGA